MATAQEVGKLIARGIGPVAKAINPHAAGGVLRQVLEVAIDGRGRLPSAKSAALAASAAPWRVGRSGHPVPDLIPMSAWPRPQGFVTNIGGLASMPVTIPANITGIAVVQVRMVAAIAHLRGYDLNDNRVRTALVMCLLGGEQVARRIAQGTLPTSPMAVATAPMFDPELDRRVAEEVVGDLAARIGGKNLALVVTKRVPLLGGGIGAVMDAIATHQIGRTPRASSSSARASVEFLLAPVLR